MSIAVRTQTPWDVHWREIVTRIAPGCLVNSGAPLRQLSTTTSQEVSDCFDDLLQCSRIECGNLCCDEVAAGCEELPGMGETGDPQRTFREIGVFEPDGSTVAVRLAGDLTQHVVAAAGIREDHGRP
ncbi:MAG: hypothetical protein A3I61_06370 [Acidobacteria bacterium RIFCSPLOWO2_02_FULL_68_18]|nr:MAG: hypothetical protein A3I61_06370 [Acidobacteria bacterium RIFCSPLOWO2_02_FULL_68_18]OFW50282.1 MAG: hypothetical protein A3G77_07365 [Acidobacteria bacterium RIFCSPLOWO2_12_FULL_68_19]